MVLYDDFVLVLKSNWQQYWNLTMIQVCEDVTVTQTCLVVGPGVESPGLKK